MAGKYRRKIILIVLSPFIFLLLLFGWILTYFGSIAYHPVGARMLLQKDLAYAIIEECEGIMLGFLSIFALVPLILFGGFPYWAYVSAGLFCVLGPAAIFHGCKRKTILEAQLAELRE